MRGGIDSVSGTKYQSTILTFDIILDWLGILQMDGLGKDQILRVLGGVRREDELPNVLLFTKTFLDPFIFTDSGFLYT